MPRLSAALRCASAHPCWPIGKPRAWWRSPPRSTATASTGLTKRSSPARCAGTRRMLGSARAVAVGSPVVVEAAVYRLNATTGDVLCSTGATPMNVGRLGRARQGRAGDEGDTRVIRSKCKPITGSLPLRAPRERRPRLAGRPFAPQRPLRRRRPRCPQRPLRRRRPRCVDKQGQKP